MRMDPVLAVDRAIEGVDEYGEGRLLSRCFGAGVAANESIAAGSEPQVVSGGY